MAGCKSKESQLILIGQLQLNLDLNNEKGEGDTSTFVLNGEWHLLGNSEKKESRR